MRISGLQGFIPVAITSVVVASEADSQTFRYNDLNQNNIQIQDESTQNHLNESFESSYQELLIKVKFYEHLKKWEAKTKFLSSPNKIIEDKDFKEILKLGKPGIKYIIDELQEKPSFLVWALNILYGFKISDDPSTTIEDASKLWVKYLKHSL